MLWTATTILLEAALKLTDAGIEPTIVRVLRRRPNQLDHGGAHMVNATKIILYKFYFI